MLTDKDMSDMIKKRTLDKIPFSFGSTATEEWIRGVTITQYMDHLSCILATKINLALPGVQEQGFIFRPLTWWDMFKKQYFPTWLRDLFPVNYEKLHVRTINHVYPQKRFGCRVVVGRD